MLAIIDDIENEKHIYTDSDVQMSDETNLNFWVDVVTPEIAKEILTHQVNNRKPNTAQVSRLASEMLEGRWIENGEPLKFNKKDELIDGQHRLLALIKSDQSFSFLFIAGYSDEAMAVLDIGKSRTSANIGQIQGISITNKHVECVNAMTFPSNVSRSNPLSKPNVIQLFKKYEEGIRFATEYKPKDIVQKRPQATTKGLIAKAYYYENTERLKDFLNTYMLNYSECDEDRSAIALLNYVNKTQKVNGDAARLDLYLRSQSALSAFVNRIPLKQIGKVPIKQDRYPLPGFYPLGDEALRRFKRSCVLGE